MLEKRKTPQAKVEDISGGFRLWLPAGEKNGYHLADLEDYTRLPRHSFPWQEGTTLRLACRVSEENLPGTWGFGLWNDPFSLSLGVQGSPRRLPVLPNACWFFHASAENHLSFAPAPTPANGFLAQVFSGARIPSGLFAPLTLASPFLLAQPVSRWAREKIAARLIREEAKSLGVETARWHEYEIQWRENGVLFLLDGEILLQSQVIPRGPLGLVLWIDNQYAAWEPNGAMRAGLLAHPLMWMEIKGLQVSQSKTPRR